MRDGQVIELSKRTGTMVEVRELIDAVGPDVARFAFLLQSIDSRQTIDIDLLSGAGLGEPGLLRAVRACSYRVGGPPG